MQPALGFPLRFPPSRFSPRYPFGDPLCSLLWRRAAWAAVCVGALAGCAGGGSPSVQVPPMGAALGAQATIVQAMPVPAGVVAACPAVDSQEQARLLAVLSPRMVYTFQEWPRLQALAQADGLAFCLFRDPRVPLDEWQAALRVAGLAGDAGLTRAPAWPVDGPPAALNHSPALLLAVAGRYHPWPIFGVMPSHAWQTLWRSRLQQLRQALD